MNKQYDTGSDRWTHGDLAHHIGAGCTFLGPCPQCGRRTFTYGVGWRCVDAACINSVSNTAPTVGPAPAWWGSGVQVFRDGSTWCAVDADFVNLQESRSGFGETPREAVEALGRDGR